MLLYELPELNYLRHKKLRKLSPIFLGHSVALFVKHCVNDGCRCLTVLEGANASNFMPLHGNAGNLTLGLNSPYGGAQLL